MGKTWRVIKNPDGSASIVLSEQKVCLIRNNGRTGYDFVEYYLDLIGRRYSNHLVAADLLLQTLLGEQYGNIRSIKKVYNSYLALTSLNCAFSSNSPTPDYEEGTGFFFKQSDCPIRAVCPFNGYNPHHKDRRIVCCNPIYELPMNPLQAKMTDMLVNTSYSLTDIAEALCLSEGRVRNLASLIYSIMEVESRQELVLLLRGKRIT